MGIGGTFTQEDINSGLVGFTNTEMELFTDSFVVDITNGANGWLPNQTIALDATTLSNDNFEISGLQLYPNPTSGSLNIQFNSRNQGTVKVTLFDVKGRTILQRDFENVGTSFTKSMDLESVANGIYIVKIQEGSYSSSKKILLSRN